MQEFDFGSRLRRLILQVCGRDVRRDLIQARNDYVLDVALNKFQTEKEESKPFRFALSSRYVKKSGDTTELL